MGLTDRDYVREGRGSGFEPRSAVFIIVVLNLVLWLVQVAFFNAEFRIEKYLACHPRDVFESFHLWQLITANFLHAADNPWHILINMLFLYFFGREVEAIYGKRDFVIFYLAAGVLAMLAQAAFGYYLREGYVPILGASGSVMATVVLFTAFYPRRELYLAFFIPIEAWLLCLLFVIYNIYGALGSPASREDNSAFVAHLTGAAFGLLYRYLDLRWASLGPLFSRRLSRFRRRRPTRRAAPPARSRPEVIPFPRESAPPERDPVSVRIDEILEKISRTGRESLSEEELEYLQRNSGRYRSER